MDIDTVLYMGASAAVVVLVLASAPNYGFMSLPIIILGVLILGIIFIMNFADFLVFPLLTKYLNVEIMLSKDHRVPKSQNCVLKYVNGLYYATGYLTANVYKYVFAAENAEAEKGDGLSEAPDNWERIVMNTNFPFKFNLISSAEDVQKYREDLEGQRGYVEFQLSKEEGATTPNELTIRELQRKINIVQTRIDRISDGEMPTYSTMYIESTSVGVSEKEATDLLTEQLSHLQTVFNAFDLSISRIVGRELHIVHGLNYRVMEMEELRKHFESQN
ncbi:MAG TPA: hypothetical protein VL945_00480 [Candidatus Saccharimonadales bacterium]|nr:hypothetical protein [Candidatus Saccharimonadales bacterium]